jgi:hypothetical protein
MLEILLIHCSLSTIFILLSSFFLHRETYSAKNQFKRLTLNRDLGFGCRSFIRGISCRDHALSISECGSKAVQWHLKFAQYVTNSIPKVLDAIFYYMTDDVLYFTDCYQYMEGKIDYDAS